VASQDKIRRRRIASNALLALAVPAATTFLDSLRGIPQVACWLLAIAGFAGYVVFIRRAVLAWEPEINDLPPPPRP